MIKKPLLFVGAAILIVLSVIVFAVPSASNVKVLPLYPTAGDDLYCNYTYSPSSGENYAEQGSLYEWWKNSTNQNINSQRLAKGNLSTGDSWYCKVTPSDGLNNGSSVQSGNSVAVNGTVKSPKMYVDNISVWNDTDYFAGPMDIVNFNSILNYALFMCNPDSQGFCNITFTFGSDDAGLLNVTDMEVYYSDAVFSLNISQLSLIHSSGTLKVFEIVLANNGSNGINGISWNMDMGDGAIISGAANFSLNSGENISIIVAHNYTDDLPYTVRANATSSFANATEALAIGDLAVRNLTVLNSSGSKRTFGFDIANLVSGNFTSVSWSFDTKNNAIINASINATLNTSESVFVFLEHNFTSAGTFNVNATGRNASFIASQNLSISVT